MWLAANIRAGNSLAAAQQAKQDHQATDTAQSAPAQPPIAPSQQPGHQVSQQPGQDTGQPNTPPKPQQSRQHEGQSASAAQSSQQPSQHAGHSGNALQGNAELPWGAPHPLQLLHDTLGTIAGRLVLQQVHAAMQKLMGENGRWAKLLKLNAAAVLPSGIRSALLGLCCYFLQSKLNNCMQSLAHTMHCQSCLVHICWCYVCELWAT